MRKKKRNTSECDRGKQLKRSLEIIATLANHQSTRRQLAEQFNRSIKTIKRDLQTIEQAGVPLVVTSDFYDDTIDSNYVAGHRYNTYRIDNHWLKRFM